MVCVFLFGVAVGWVAEAYGIAVRRRRFPDSGLSQPAGRRKSRFYTLRRAAGLSVMFILFDLLESFAQHFGNIARNHAFFRAIYGSQIAGRAMQEDTRYGGGFGFVTLGK